MTAKRLTIVLALACAFTMMFAGVALGAAADGDGYSDPSYGATAATPHMGYTTTTVKCAVCHAVHRAPVAGQVLLRSTVANACTYCHISDNVSTVKVYGQNEANYTGDFDNNHQSSGSVTAGNSSCVSCHAVHGAGSVTTTQTGSGDVATKILKANISTAQNVSGAWSFTVGTDKEGVVTAFCTQCHPYWTNQYDKTASDSSMHIMTATTGDGYSSRNTSATINSSLAVAWTPSTYCRSCHDAGGTDQTGDGTLNENNFPHYTASASRFLKSAASVDTSLSAIGAANPSQDGACLKCHRQNSTTGVGLTY
ncbi:MAG: hypothetical protein Q7J82_02495 [Coriobacteriia bacterium]|nr:hypothetical protein [Coriobacteriia bacterium]